MCLSHTTPRPQNVSSNLLFLASWQCGTHLEGCIRSKHWAFVWAHDALRCQRGTEQDGSFTHYVPRPPKEPDLSAPAPPQRWINGPDKAHYVSVQQGRKRSTRLSHAPNMRRSHALVKFDMMFAGLVSSVLHCPTSWSCFCSTAENVKNKYNKTKQNKE